MCLGFREHAGRSFCLLAVFGLLAAAAPGCGDAPKDGQGGASPVPASVQESNKDMENFMKSQAGTKAKK